MKFLTAPRLQNRPRGECTVVEVTYQRNGVSGEGFHVVAFDYSSDSWPAGAARLLGVVFGKNKHVAVIDPTNLESHWRGDSFEDGLREVVTAWEEARFG